MARKPKTTARPAIPIAAALGRVTESLVCVGARLLRVEAAIGEMAGNPNVPVASIISDVQELDRSVQEISALTEFLDIIARQATSAWAVDAEKAAASIGLHELAVWLGSGEIVAPHQHSQAETHFDSFCDL